MVKGFTSEGGVHSTSSSLLSDLLSILRGNIKYPFGISLKEKSIKAFNNDNYQTLYVLRFEVNDNQEFFLNY